MLPFKIFTSFFLCIAFTIMAAAQLAPNLISEKTKGFPQKTVNYAAEEELEITYEQISYIAAGDSVANIAAAQKYFSNSSFNANHKKYLNLGIAKDNYWVAFTLVNTTPLSAELIINLGNPRLNEVDVFIVKKNQQKLFFKLGDNFPFLKRVLYYNQFAVPVTLAAMDTLQVLMYMQHKGNTLQVPISVHTQNSFYKQTENNYLITGITTGILLLTFFFSIFLFFKSTNRLFIFYSLYVLNILLWVFSTEGYGFQYLWPGQPEWATRFGPGFSVFNLTTFIATALAFTKPYDNTKWIRRILTAIVISSFLWGLQAFMPYFPVTSPVVMAFYLKTSFIIYGISLSIILLYLLYVSIKKNKIVFFYFFAIFISIGFTILVLAKHSGWINLPLTSATFMSFGIVFEIILMTLGIANQFYLYKKEKEEMLIQYIEQQKSITQKILETQEQERKRISREMHDDIGAGLTQITLMSESAKENKSNANLDDIANTSRQLVNSMSEIIWSMNPENRTLEQLCVYLREQLNKQLEYAGVEYSVQLPESEKEIILTSEQRRNILLVTKETVNNAIKYSNAKNILVNAVLKNEGLTFIVKDDGEGFDINTIHRGNGLKNIKNRIEEVEGTLEVVSKPGEGSSFTYFVPLVATT